MCTFVQFAYNFRELLSPENHTDQGKSVLFWEWRHCKDFLTLLKVRLMLNFFQFLLLFFSSFPILKLTEGISLLHLSLGNERAMLFWLQLDLSVLGKRCIICKQHACLYHKENKTSYFLFWKKYLSEWNPEGHGFPLLLIAVAAIKALDLVLKHFYFWKLYKLLLKTLIPFPVGTSHHLVNSLPVHILCILMGEGHHSFCSYLMIQQN